jgi:hypothetical protein
MTGISGLKIFVSGEGHGDMSLTDFENKGFGCNDSVSKRAIRRIKSFPAIYWRVIQNRINFFRTCEINPRQVFCPTLGPTDKVIFVNRLNKDRFGGSGVHFSSRFKCDAIITDVFDLALMFLPADCPVVILFDRRRHVLAQIHSGREGILKNIAGKVAGLMKEEYFCDPSDIVAWFSPHLCKDCHILSFLSFLGNPEYKKIKPAIVEVKGGWSFDMRLAIEIQLGLEGISNVIPGPTTCTLCGEEDLYSHRGWSSCHPDHPVPGRFAVISMMAKI